MDFWAKHIEQISEGMEALATIDPIKYEKSMIYLLLKYLDDILTLLEEMKTWMKWDPISLTLMLDQAKAKSDIDNKTDPEFITMQNFCNIASSITEGLNFKWDSPKRSPTHKMPVLDLQVWVGQGDRSLGLLGGIPNLENMNLPTKMGNLKQIFLYEF